MATFLALTQKLARESGTISGTLPTAVAGQTGRLGQMVQWTNDAWKIIQNAHPNWLWMQGEFYGDLADGTQRYAYTAFNDFATSAAIARFRNWLYSETMDSGISLYDTAVGVGEEGSLRFRTWDNFFNIHTRGTQTEAKPQVFSISPDRKLCFGPTPDINTYRVRGRYVKSAQELSADADTPEMPAEHHDLIVDVGLMLIDVHDESPQFQLHQLRKLASFCALERDQLPRFRTAGPLA